MTIDPGSAYREEAARSENKLHLVVVLYEQLVRDLVRAEAAIASGDIERRTAEMNHALQVLGQLHGRLDFERGGEVARNLDRFYNQLWVKLEEAHFKASAEILREQISLLLMLRDAWMEVERHQPSSGQANTEPASNPAAKGTPAERMTSNWRA